MKKRKIEVPLQNGKELKPIMIKPNMGRIIKPMAKFPDLSGDGKVTQKDILMGRGVIKKPKMTFDGDKNNKNIEKQLKNAVVLDNVDFRLNEADQQTGSALESLRDAVKRRREKGGVEGAAASRARFDKARGLFEGSNISPGSLTANADGSITFRLKDMIDVPGMGKRRVGGRYIMDSEGNISHQAGKKYAPSPYFSKIGIKPNMKKDTPKRTQIKKTGRELQNALIKEQNKPVTKQDKRVINQLQGAIEEQKKKLKNPTMKKPKMYKKPKMGAMNVKKTKTSIDRSSYKKKKLTRSEKLANKASRISKKKTAVVAAKGRSSEKAARIIKKENRIYNREAKVNAKKAGAPTRKTRTVTKTGNKKVVNVADKTGSIIKTKEKRISRPTMKKPKMYNKPKYYGKKKK